MTESNKSYQSIIDFGNNKVTSNEEKNTIDLQEVFRAINRRKKIITRGLPSNLPDAIEVNIEDLKIGDFIYIKDLTSDNYTFLAPDSSVVVGVKTARGAIEDEIEDDNEVDSESDKSSDAASESENKTDKEPAKEESSEQQE